MRFCPNCGTGITPGLTICASCGAILPVDRLAQPAPDQYAETIMSSPYSLKDNATPPGGGTPAPPQSGSYAPTMSANPATPGYNIPAPSGSGTAYAPPSTPGISGYNNMASPSGSGPAYGAPAGPGIPGYNTPGPLGSGPAYGTPAYPSMPPAQGEYYGQMLPPPPPIPGAGVPPPAWPTPQPPWATPQPKKKKMSAGFLVLLALIAIILAAGSCWLAYYAAVARPAALRTQATATAQANSTASAQAQGTAAAQAQIQATATAGAQAQATATAEQALYTQATSGTPVLNSPLTGQDTANWDLYNAVGGGGCAFTNGSLHASVMQTNYYVPCFALNPSYNNFVLQVQMTIVKGDEGGLIFRGNSTTSQYYLFRVGQNGSYGLYLSRNDKNSVTLAENDSAAIKKGAGQTNLLTLIAKGSDIYLYINKQYVEHVNDTTYTSGKIGLFGSNSGNPTDAAFSNVQVWQL